MDLQFFVGGRLQSDLVLEKQRASGAFVAVRLSTVNSNGYREDVKVWGRLSWSDTERSAWCAKCTLPCLSAFTKFIFTYFYPERKRNITNSGYAHTIVARSGCLGCSYLGTTSCASVGTRSTAVARCRSASFAAGRRRWKTTTSTCTMCGGLRKSAISASHWSITASTAAASRRTAGARSPALFGAGLRSAPLGATHSAPLCATLRRALPLFPVFFTLPFLYALLDLVLDVVASRRARCE